MTPTPAPVRPPVARRGLALTAGAFLLALIAGASGYGYHRDELYFRLIGAHPAFGYVDQPPLVPLLDHAVDVVGGQSLFWLRVPPALAGAALVVVTGLLAREFGGDAPVQVLAALGAAAASIVVSAAHLATTTAFDLLGWTLTSWLLVRALRDGGRTWLVAGLVAGISLQIKTLPVFLLVAVTVGVLAVGPRPALRSRWPWLGATIALVLWAPALVWQATHGWPQLELSGAIASGSSGTSESRWAFLPFQLVLVSPLLVPVWVAGLWRLWRDPALGRWRAFAVAYPVLAVVLIAAGGKPYYLCGLYPVLLAAGAAPTLAWARRGVRRVLLAAGLVLSAAVSAVLMLPVVPVADLGATPVVAINYDAGETVGWPAFAGRVAAVQRVHPGSVVLTRNYGEYGALARFRPATPVFSGHNSLWDLGPPAETVRTAVVVGYDRSEVAGWFASCRKATVLDNYVDLDNDEQGATVFVCADPTGGWRGLWPRVRRLG